MSSKLSHQMAVERPWLLVNGAIILQNVMFLTLVKYFPSKKACDEWIQLHNHVRATGEITPHLMRQTCPLGEELNALLHFHISYWKARFYISSWKARLYISSWKARSTLLLHIILEGEVQRSMLIPPFAVFLLLRPRSVDALQHQPNLLASSIQVLSSGIYAFDDILVKNYLYFPL